MIKHVGSPFRITSMTCCVMGQYGLVGFIWIYLHLFGICTAKTSRMDLKDTWSVSLLRFILCFVVLFMFSCCPFFSLLCFRLLPAISLITKQSIMMMIYIYIYNMILSCCSCSGCCGSGHFMPLARIDSSTNLQHPGRRRRFDQPLRRSRRYRKCEAKKFEQHKTVCIILLGISKNSGTLQSAIFIGFSIINHSFWGTPIVGNTHIVNSQRRS